jgi:hypothetical protein
VGRTSRGARYSCPRCRQLLVTGFDRRAAIPPAVAFWCRCGQLSEVP